MQNSSWQWGDPFKSREVVAQRATLSLRQETLKDELLRMRQQQLLQARRERRAELRAQVERLESQVCHYEALNTVSTNSMRENTSWATSGLLDEPQQRFPGSSDSLIERLVQQNEQIVALLLPRKREEDASRATNALKRSSKESLENSLKPSDEANSNAKFPSVQGVEERHDTTQQEIFNEVPAKKSQAPSLDPTAISWLPDFEWTDEDEITLDKLEKDEGALADVPGSEMVDTSAEKSEMANATAKAGSPVEQKARDRLESRKRLEALLSASLKNANGGALRKPRWRLEAEADSDDVSPFEVQDAEAMEPLQVFRSAVLAVLYTVHLKDLLMTKKLAEKESAMKDFEAMLRVYFDATRMWVGKVVRAPLVSLLQDSSLDVDISTKSGLAGSSLRGFAKKFGGILARRLPPPASGTGKPVESAVDPGKLLKLKVRMRGILQALSKAIDKKEVPSGILDFWKRISSDGVYFPPSYQLFDEERQHLEFDPLGATRRMDFGGSSEVDGFSRFNVVVINFLLVRILIPHVVLQPWSVGIGSKNIGKQASANLVSLATLLYCVCRKLSPLPPSVEPPEASFLGRRRSKTVAISQRIAGDERPDQPPVPLNGIDPALAPPESQEEEHAADSYFLSIDEIGRRLIPDKNFPCQDPQVIQVVQEQQSMLYETLEQLRAQLHGSQEKL